MTTAVRRARAQDASEVARLYAQLVANPALNVRPDRLAELETDRKSVV